MKFAIVLACFVALAAAAAVENKQPEADTSTNVEVADQDAAEYYDRGYYGGYYNPYGYRSYGHYRGNYYGAGHGHWRGRRSAPEDQTAEESDYSGWGHHGYNRGYHYGGYPSYRHSYYYNPYPSSYSYSYRNHW